MIILEKENRTKQNKWRNSADEQECFINNSTKKGKRKRRGGKNRSICEGKSWKRGWADCWTEKNQRLEGKIDPEVKRTPGKSIRSPSWIRCLKGKKSCWKKWESSKRKG